MKMHVKLMLCLAAGIFFLLPAVNAQIAIDLSMNRQNYLQFEKVFAKVVLRNDSGHAIVFGHDEKLQGELLFEIRDAQNVPIKKITQATPPIVGTILKAGETKEFIVPITRYYNLNTPGKYKVMAYITHALFKNEYRSNDCFVNVSEGHMIWSRNVGIPEFMKPKNKSRGEDSAQEQTKKIDSRTFNIKTIYEGSRKVYFMVVEDENTVFSIKRFGLALGDEQPQFDTDNLSRLHVLLPLSPRIFSYLVFDVNGNVEKQEIYKKTTTIPTLVNDPKTGGVILAGGELGKRGVDYQDDVLKGKQNTPSTPADDSKAKEGK
ncbi:MAG: hypothetical protein ACYC4Q_10730 [Victivallaceae bacterium]